VVGRQEIYVRGVSEYVTFTTPDPVNYPLPNPQYLAIHAACAKVAHMSGAAATIDKYHDDGDDGQTSDPIGVPELVAKHAASKMPIAGYA